MLRIDLDLDPSGRDPSIDSSRIPVSYHASHHPVYFDPCSVAIGDTAMEKQMETDSVAVRLQLELTPLVDWANAAYAVVE
jgi:hypothetical protein